MPFILDGSRNARMENNHIPVTVLTGNMEERTGTTRTHNTWMRPPPATRSIPMLTDAWIPPGTGAGSLPPCEL